MPVLVSTDGRGGVGGEGQSPPCVRSPQTCSDSVGDVEIQSDGSASKRFHPAPAPEPSRMMISCPQRFTANRFRWSNEKKTNPASEEIVAIWTPEDSNPLLNPSFCGLNDTRVRNTKSAAGGLLISANRHNPELIKEEEKTLRCQILCCSHP